MRGVSLDTVRRWVNHGRIPEPEGHLGGAGWWWSDQVDGWDIPEHVTITVTTTVARQMSTVLRLDGRPQFAAAIKDLDAGPQPAAKTAPKKPAKNMPHPTGEDLTALRQHRDRLSREMAETDQRITRIVSDGARVPLSINDAEHRTGIPRSTITRHGPPSERIGGLAIWWSDELDTWAALQPEHRIEDLTRWRAEGRTTAWIAHHLGVSPKRVTRIIRGHDIPRPSGYEAIAAQWGDQIRERAHTAGSPAAVAADLGIHPDLVRAFVRDNDIRFAQPIDGGHRLRSYPTDECYAAVRSAYAEIGPENWTIETYRAWSQAGPDRPSPATLRKRCGRWTDMCSTLGLPHRAPGEIRTGQRQQWTTQRCIEVVRQWLNTNPTRVNTSALATWSRTSGVAVPSLPTMQQRVGPWRVVVACARLWQEIIDSGAMTPDDIAT